METETEDFANYLSKKPDLDRLGETCGLKRKKKGFWIFKKIESDEDYENRILDVIRSHAIIITEPLDQILK